MSPERGSPPRAPTGAAGAAAAPDAAGAGPVAGAALARLAAAFGPLEPGRLLWPGVRLLGLRVGAAIELTLALGGAAPPLGVRFERRDDAAPSFARTRGFNVRYLGTDPGPRGRAALERLVTRLAAADRAPLPVDAFGAGAAADPAAPVSFDLAVFAGCDNDCHFCSTRPQGIKRSSLASILERLAEHRQRGANTLELSAMEPTLDKRLPAIVAEARRLGYSTVHLVTNGHRLADRAVAAGYLEAGVTRVTVSLNASHRELEGRLCGNPETFDRKRAALVNLVALGATVAVNSVITALGLGDLPALAALLADLGVGRWHLFLPVPAGNALIYVEQIVPPPAALRGPLGRAARIAAERGLAMSVCDVPPCLVGPEVPLGRKIVKTFATSAEEPARIERFHPGHRKGHGPRCAACRLRPGCDGLFDLYAERFGWEALVPR
jgi:MoaA/NifB/PqqE/SkfB family radical SAM enzyme